MDDEPTMKLPVRSKVRRELPTYEDVDKPTLLMPIAISSAMPPFKKRKTHKKRVLQGVLIVLLLLMAIVGGTLAYGYSYYDTNVQAPLKKFIHPVHRSAEEPALNVTPSYNVVMGRSWNILLMGSDNDGKYTFPDVLTQVMMVVHIDTVHGSVSMVSIPRDSWVHLPEVGGMHKIDQAFFLAATQKNSFDDGVRVARLTVEKDYGISIDRYGWVGLSGFAKVIDTLSGVDVDIVHPIVDDSYPDDTGDGANPNDPYALKRISLAPGLQQVLEALKKKLTVETLLADLPQLIKDLLERSTLT